MSNRLHGGLVLGVFLCLLFPLTALAVNFTDINNHWAKQQILQLQAGGYIKGYADNTFRPDQPMTRAGFVSLLINCLGGTKTEDSQGSNFDDVRGHWSSAAVNRAVKLGIVVSAEYPNGFAPDNPIKRSEAAAMLVRALAQKPDNGNLTFKDTAQINKSLYKGYIKKAVELKLISGYNDGYFRPFNSLTRCQTCVMMLRLLDIKGTTLPTTTNTTTSNSGQVIRIGSERYSIGNAPIYLSIGGQSIAIGQYQISGNQVKINLTNEYQMNSILTGVDLIVFNNRYSIASFSNANGELVANTMGRKLVSLTVNGLKYDASMVNLLISGDNSMLYLGDALIQDANNLQINNHTYNLLTQEAYVTLSGESYRLRGFNISNTGDTLLITDSTPISMFKYPSLSSISNIYVNNTSLNYDYRTARIFFIINNERYELSNVTIEASGSITAGGINYLPSQVTMFYNDNYYKLSEIRLADHNFSLYCSYSDITNLVSINNKYRSTQGVQILKDSTPYSLSEVYVVSRNLIRIGGRQYTLDSTIKARYDGVLYDITEINFETSSNIVLLTTQQATAYTTGSIPQYYSFYEGSSLLQNGTSGVLIYAGSSQISFSQITGIDPYHFVWSSTYYDLIGTRVCLNNINYTISDTLWRGSTGRFEIYLSRI
ncbi:MAG: S-layer homology domain-containing protein [Methylocystaceae bacterium]